MTTRSLKQPAVRTATQKRKQRTVGGVASFSVSRQLAKALHELLGPICEVVLHDLGDLEHSIIHIEGSVTHRAIGGAATDLILEKVAQGDTEQDLHGYATSLPGGRLMKSSTIFLRDEDNCAIGALCVNLDLTDFVAMRNLLNAFVHVKDSERTTETLSDNISETVQSAVDEALYDTGRSLPSMSREDRIALISQLEARGLFQVKKAVPIVADTLGLSRATVYNYLRQGRGKNGHVASSNARTGKT